MFAIVKIGSVMVIGAVALSIDPIIGGAFTILNTVLISRLNNQNHARTEIIIGHIEDIDRKMLKHHG